jgi:hypothetical protein
MNLKDLLGEKYSPEMTIEEIEEQLESMDLIDSSALEGKVDKTKLDEALSKLAKATKENRAIKKEQDTKENDIDTLRNELEELKKEKVISEQTSKLIALGYTEEDAKTTATALVGGDYDTVLESVSKLTASVEQNMKAEILQGTKRPQGGSSEKTYKSADIHNMSLSELQNLKNTDSDVFSQISKGEE